MKMTVLIASLCVSLSLSAFAAEDPAAMEAMKKIGAPGEKHAALKPLVGKWTTTVKFWSAPNATPEVSSGTSEKMMVLGDRFLKEDYTGTMMNMPFNGIGMTGYDNVKQSYVATWSDTNSTAVINLEGSADGSGKVITTTGECKNPMTKKPMKMKMVTRIEGNDRHVFENWMRDPKGKEYRAVEIVYTRM